MYVIIATSPNYPTRYHLADNPTDAQVMLNDLKYLCWSTKVVYIPVINDLVVHSEAFERIG